MSETANTWDSLVGHEWAVTMLKKTLQHGHVGQAYLFTGPQGVGKTALAHLFAQALNCQANNPAAQPCGACRSCQLIAADRHPDVRVIEPELSSRGQRTLKIEQIRDLQQGLSLASYEARWKIALITHFDAATQGAANAFLKTLEEPPARVLLLLTAAEADALLPTITSRCRVINLRPLSAPQIAGALARRWQVPAEEARLLAHLADGRMGWALTTLKRPEELESRQEKLETIHAVLSGGRVERFAVADNLAKSPEIVPPLLQMWITWWRDLALIAWGVGYDDALTNIDQETQLRQAADRWSRQQILASLKQTRQAVWQLAHNANTRLVLENLFLVYPLPEQEKKG